MHLSASKHPWLGIKVQRSQKRPDLRLVSGADPVYAASAPSPEERLFQKIQSNAADWQRETFDLFYVLVSRLMAKALGPSSEVEDLVGDVFLSLFENARNIRSATSLRSYVVSVAMNAARRELRRRKQRAWFGSLAGSSDDLDRRPSVDDPRAKAALLQLDRILDELDSGERIAFVLHSLEGMQLEEVAAALDVSHSTAKRRVRRALEHLTKRVSRNALLSDYIRERTGRSDG